MDGRNVKENKQIHENPFQDCERTNMLQFFIFSSLYSMQKKRLIQIPFIIFASTAQNWYADVIFNTSWQSIKSAEGQVPE